ncbi:MAG TPA: hypothetical protein PKY81_12140 [bacterium]|nr:hypothetical protein [bacterium]HPN31695.1 hypothetical protein [bacterium]
MNLIKINYGSETAELNMSIDANLAEKSAIEEVSFYRIYGWKSPSVTTGYFQKQNDSINLDYCKKNNIPVVKRPTGGKAILHDNDFTFAVIINNNLLNFSKIADYYRLTNSALNASLNELKIGSLININKQKINVKDPVCFNHTSDYELEWNGKKIVGTAIRKFNKCVLIQGNLPMKINYKLYSEIFYTEVENLRTSFCGLNEITAAENINLKFGEDFIEKLSDIFYRNLSSEIKKNGIVK